MKRWSRIVAMFAVLSLLVVACTGEERRPDEAGEVVGEPAATGSPDAGSDAGSDAVPIPEGQSLMDPGRYLARTFPEAVITTTTPWYGAANVPGFADFGQLDEFPYAELMLVNLLEVVADPKAPGDPLETMPPPDDLFAWFVERTGVETVGEPISVEIDGSRGSRPTFVSKLPRALRGTSGRSRRRASRSSRSGPTCSRSPRRWPTACTSCRTSRARW